MYAPLRLVYGLRPHASAGLLAAALAAGLMFMASPFTIPDVADHFDVGVGFAGILSTAQVGGFAVANLVAGRRLRPSAGLLRGALLALVVMDVASALSPALGLLLGARVGAGAAAGLVTWVAWSDAMHERRRLADVAAVGPVGAIVAAPVLGALVAAGGFRFAYLALAAVAAVALTVPPRLEAPLGRRSRRVSPSRTNRLLLAALPLLTLAGSMVYVYAAEVAAEQLGLGPLAASFAYSLNAAGGVAATRLRLPRTGTALWFLVIAAAVLGVGMALHSVLFYLSMALWGFAFWMAVPRVLQLLAERSLSPDERVGDAQAGMAVGRALGPLAGAPLANAGAFAALGLASAAGAATVALVVASVQVFRRQHLEPSAPPVLWRL